MRPSSEQVGQLLEPYRAALNIVQHEGACALPGVSIKYESFIPVMWQAVSRGFVSWEHATFVEEGLRYGFRAGVVVSKLYGHRWFKNYPTALTATGRDAVSRATMKRVQSGKTLDLGRWSPALANAIKSCFSKSAIFPVGCVPKPLEPTEMRPTDDHTRTGLNAATDLSFLRHSLETYSEIAWFLKQDYFMRVLEFLAKRDTMSHLAEASHKRGVRVGRNLQPEPGGGEVHFVEKGSGRYTNASTPPQYL
jgi:hypothetical protein